MKLSEQMHRLRIVIGEARKHKGKPLYEWIVMEARSAGIAGATVQRGMMGYGGDAHIKTTSILRLSEDLPVIIELVDTQEALERLLDAVDPAITRGLVTIEEVKGHMYRAQHESS